MGEFERSFGMVAIVGIVVWGFVYGTSVALYFM